MVHIRPGFLLTVEHCALGVAFFLSETMSLPLLSILVLSLIMETLFIQFLGPLQR